MQTDQRDLQPILLKRDRLPGRRFTRSWFTMSWVIGSLFAQPPSRRPGHQQGRDFDESRRFTRCFVAE